MDNDDGTSSAVTTPHTEKRKGKRKMANTKKTNKNTMNETKTALPATIGKLSENGCWIPHFWAYAAKEYGDALHIRFCGKPTAQARDLLKTAGMRYHARDNYWYLANPQSDIVVLIIKYLKENLKLVKLENEAEYIAAQKMYKAHELEIIKRNMYRVAVLKEQLPPEKPAKKAAKEEPAAEEKQSLADLLKAL